MPSPLRTQVEQERAERRTSWYQNRRPQNAGPSGATSLEVVQDAKIEDEPQSRRERRARS